MTKARRKRTSRRAYAGTPPRGASWSAAVTRGSNALDLEPGVFRMAPLEMARSLKRSADRGRRRKAPPFRSAMSMLVFFQNRAGRSLSAERRRAIERAKVELRRIYGRE